MLFELWFSIAEIWPSVVIIVVFLKCPLNCLCCHPLFGFCVFIKMVSLKAILVDTSATYVEGFTCPSWSFCLFVFLSVFCVLAMNALSVYFRLMSLIFFWPYWNITLCRVQMIYFFLNWRTCNAFLDRFVISTPWPLPQQFSCGDFDRSGLPDSKQNASLLSFIHRTGAYYPL